MTRINEEGVFISGALSAISSSAEFLPSGPASSPDLTPVEFQVLSLASLGGTVQQVASLMSRHTLDIEVIRDTLTHKFDQPNMAAVVNQAIRHLILPIHKNPDINRPGLSSKEIHVLGLIAAGKSNRQIAIDLGKTTGTLVSNINRPLFKKLRANGRTHSVRRSYENKIFDVDTS